MQKESVLHELHIYAGGGEEREVELSLSRGSYINVQVNIRFIVDSEIIKGAVMADNFKSLAT